MRLSAAVALLGSALACGGPAAPLYPAGTIFDEGGGELAQASMQLLTPAPPEAARRTAMADPLAEPDPCNPDGRSAGGAAYGGSTYADYVVPQWRSTGDDRKPRYRPSTGLSGAIEGVITWRGAVPEKPITSCGAIEPLALDGNKALAGALVYIEHVSVGRPIPTEGNRARVGGLVVKRGCALAPAVQIATPVPSALVIHGDAKRAQLRVTPPAGAAKTYELLEAGRVGLQVPAGVTRIDAADGSFASAWVIGLETPYYALTDDRGRFRIDELAGGTYEVTIWQPPPPALAGGALTYGAPIVARRIVRVERARTSRLDVALGR